MAHIDPELIGDPHLLLHRKVTFQDEKGNKHQGEIIQAYGDYQGAHLTIKEPGQPAIRKGLLGYSIGMLIQKDSGDIEVGLGKGEVVVIHAPTQQESVVQLTV